MYKSNYSLCPSAHETFGAFSLHYIVENELSILFLSWVEFCKFVIFKRWMFLPDWTDLATLPEHTSSNFKVSFVAINTPTSESNLSDTLKSLKSTIGQILSQIKDLAFRWILIIVNFPNTILLRKISEKVF